MSRSDSSLQTQGAWEVRRRIQVPALAHPHDAEEVTRALAVLPGVRGVRADAGGHRVTLVYDLRELEYGQVLEALERAGFPPPDGRWMRLKTRWLRYLDLNGRLNADAPAPPCCSHPRGLDRPKR